MVTLSRALLQHSMASAGAAYFFFSDLLCLSELPILRASIQEPPGKESTAM